CGWRRDASTGPRQAYPENAISAEPASFRNGSVPIDDATVWLRTEDGLTDATDKESAMKLATVLWLTQLLPQPYADQACLATTVYLEARNQSELGQRAVAEVALRRLDSGRWGDNLCAVVTAPRQFAPTLVSPNYDMDNL